MRLKPFKFAHYNRKQQLDIRRVLMEYLLRDQNSHKKYIKEKLDKMSILLEMIGVFTVINCMVNCIKR